MTITCSESYVLMSETGRVHLLLLRVRNEVDLIQQNLVSKSNLLHRLIHDSLLTRVIKVLFQPEGKIKLQPKNIDQNKNNVDVPIKTVTFLPPHQS